LRNSGFAKTAFQRRDEFSQSSALREARKLLDEDRLADALQLQESRVKENPEDNDARVLMARVHSHNGEVEKATALLEAGLNGAKSDMELLWYLGHMRIQLGEDGPNVTRTRGTVSYAPSKMTKEEEAAWQNKQWGMAVETWRKFLSHSPDHEKAAQFAARALAAWKGSDHLKHLGELCERFPDNSNVALSYAEALVSAGKPENALATAQRQTKAQPRSAVAWSMQAKVLKALGKIDEGTDAAARAAFYESLPACAALEYSPKTAARLAAMEENPRAESEKLIADRSEESSHLMAVLCWRHIAHGPVEDSCFAELAARKQGDLLCDLAEEGQSICTYRGCCRGLAKLKHPRAFDVISGFLPGDTNPVFYIEAAGALALLADDRAVPLLVKTLAPGFREKDRQRPEQEEGFMGDGPLLNRVRCGFALATFDTLAVRQALAEGAKNPDIAPCCVASLYRLTKDSTQLKALEAAMTKAGDKARYFRTGVVALLSEMDVPEAKQTAERLHKAGKDEDQDPIVIEADK
jgi:Flp pilus assembly protein TadD